MAGRGTTRAEDAQGTPNQSHRSPSILVYEEKRTSDEGGVTGDGRQVTGDGLAAPSYNPRARKRCVRVQGFQEGAPALPRVKWVRICIFANVEALYRGTSLIRNCPPLGPYRSTMPRAIWWS